MESNSLTLRNSIIESLPVLTSVYSLEKRPISVFYTDPPPAHEKALRLEANLVIGSRGVGKSFWTAALNSPELRAQLVNSVPDLDSTIVQVGFSDKSNVLAYPNAEVFTKLLDSGYSSYEIWRSVVVRAISTISNFNISIGMGSWDETVSWVRNNPGITLLTT